MSDPPQYIPVGELDTENSVLFGRGYNRESVHIHALSWNSLSTALKIKIDKSILLGVPRREKRGVRFLRGTALKRRGPNPTSRAALIVSRMRQGVTLSRR